MEEIRKFIKTLRSNPAALEMIQSAEEPANTEEAAEQYGAIAEKLGISVSKENILKYLNAKELNRLANILSGGDTYRIAGRAPFKDEFVTCGGIALSSVNPATLESRHVPHLYFAGEVLDIDGITGGFNFQAAWTTAHTVAQAIKKHNEASPVVS